MTTKRLCGWMFWLLVVFCILTALGVTNKIFATDAVDAVPKLIDRSPTSDSVYINNDCVYLTIPDSVASKLLHTDSIHTSIIKGAQTTLDIGNDTVRIGVDSTGLAVVIWFGGTGGGLKWGGAVDDHMYYTADGGATWTLIGSGGGSSLFDDSTTYLRPTSNRKLRAIDPAGTTFSQFGSTTWMTTATTLIIGANSDTTNIKMHTTTDTVGIDVKLAVYGDEIIFKGVVCDSALWDSLCSGLLGGGGGSYTKYDSVTYLRVSLDTISVYSFGHLVVKDTAIFKETILGHRIIPADSTSLFIGSGNTTSAEFYADSLKFYGIKFDSLLIDSIVSQKGRFAGTGGASDSVWNQAYRGTDAVADSAYPTWHYVNSQIAAAGGGDITGVAMGNGGTGGGTSGDVTVNVVPGTSTGLAVNADSIYVANSVDSAKLLVAGEGTASRAGRLTADSIIVDTLHTTRLSFAAGGAFTSLLGTGLTNVGGALTAHLNTLDHNRSHSWSSASDHTANAYKLLYAGSSGTLAELSIAAGVLGSPSSSGNPTWYNGTTSEVLHGGSGGAVSFGAVANGDLGSNAVDSTKVADGSLTGSDLQNNTVGWLDQDSTTTKLYIYDIASDSARKAAGDSIATHWTAFIGSGTLNRDSFYVYVDTSNAVKNSKAIYDKIDTTAAKIPTATVADSAKTIDTSGVRLAGLLGDRIHDSLNANWSAFITGAAVWDSLYKHIDSAKVLYDKIDTTTAKIPTALVADSSVFTDTAKISAMLKTSKELYDKIDTTAAKIPTATLADSATGAARINFAEGSHNHAGRMDMDSLHSDTLSGGRLFVGANHRIFPDSVRFGTQFYTSADSNRIGVDAGIIVNGSGAVYFQAETAESIAVTKKRAEIIAGDSGIGEALAVAKTIAGNWVNTANPWAVNEGGTGAATFAANGVLYGNGTSAIGATAVGAGHLLLHGNGIGSAPSFDSLRVADMAGQIITKTQIDTTASNFVFDDAFHVTSATADSEYATLGFVKTRRQIVPLDQVGSQDHALGDNMIVTLGQFMLGDSIMFLFKDSSAAADQEDTVMVQGVLPAYVTQVDSIIVLYNSSSATATTSKIDAIRVWTTNGWAGRAVYQKDYTTDLAATAITAVDIMGGADADFDEGETVTLRFISNCDANAWVKVYGVYAICH